MDKVKRYTIMFENTLVLEFNRETDEVIIFDREHLPFALRGKDRISVVSAFEWLSDRINNLNRIYMDIARKVGRDKDKVIKDSSGITTDCFIAVRILSLNLFRRVMTTMLPFKKAF